MQEVKKVLSNTNKGWILILAGGICEIFWVSGLKYADSLLLYILTAIGVSFSFCCAIIAFRFIEVSVGYAVFVGIGAAGIVVAEMLVFGEEVSFMKLLLIGILLCGVIGLKFVDKPKKDSNNLESKNQIVEPNITSSVMQKDNMTETQVTDNNDLLHTKNGVHNV